MEKVRLGIIGLGSRGYCLMKQEILSMEDVLVTAVCDAYEDRAEKAADTVQEKSGVRPVTFTDHRALLACGQIDAVLITCSWENHIAITCEAMEAGIPTGCEVGGFYDVQDGWKLVETYERTRTPVMFMENCCYGRNELMMLNMKKLGVLGEIIHCDGGYNHDLRNEVAFGRENRHYRLENYRRRNGENYPTHELGPIARLLDIGHGNRMVSLFSMASCSRGLHGYILKEKGADYDLAGVNFAQGDVITTVIKCAGGQTIRLSLDTTLPRAYSRGLAVHGTKGSYIEDNQSVFLDGEHNSFEFSWQKQWNNIEEYRDKYEHPLWIDFLKDGVHGGHDGIDWLELRDFVTCIKEGKDFPIDVYDMAAWAVITPLSEQSIAIGMPVAIPDYTRGQWLHK